MLLESKIKKFLDANEVIDKKISSAKNGIEYHKKAIEKKKIQIGILQKEKNFNIRKISELKTRIIHEQTGIDLANVDINKLLTLMKNNKKDLLIDTDIEKDILEDVETNSNAEKDISKDIEDININTNVKESFTDNDQQLSNIGIKESFIDNS